MGVDSLALLAAWEQGATAPETDRAPSLLRTLGWLAPDSDPAELTVGACDARLFMLRRAIFGDRLEATSVCPGCGEEVELELSLTALQPPVDHERPAQLHVSENGYEILCRPLLNHDLSALAGRGPTVELGDVLGRCVTDARAPDGSQLDGAEIPPSLGEAVLRVVAACDPGAQVSLDVRCSCGVEFNNEFDIREALWTEVTDWVTRTLTEVHALARAYGWSEAEVLALSDWRRRWYLEAVGW